MDSYFLPGIYRYLATHSELSVTLTGSVVAIIGLMMALALREGVRTTRPPADDLSHRVALRRFNVTVVPLLFVVAVTVIERFRLLA